jgi:glycosyltransferase involved in cell wall biosynthesis
VTAPRRALVISENAPVPADRRVWNISRSLVAAGWEVVVVCAQGAEHDALPYEVRDGVEIVRYALRPAAGPADYAREYAQALWRLRRLIRCVSRSRQIDVVHACNPPDVLALAARGLRRRGTRFVFDHHDLVPELYLSKFGGPEGSAAHRATLAAERFAFRGADVSLATNESYRRVAIERGGMDPEDVFVVRNGPDLERFRPFAPDPALREGRRHLIAYLGIMGPQDGVDHALRALAWLHARRDDFVGLLIGDGEVLPAMRALATELGIDDCVRFAGWRGDDDIRRMLSTASVCLAPDPPSPLNERSTMMKIPEYLAIGCPVASYDLPESRVSAGDAALYARAGDPDALGAAAGELLDDPELRARMGAEGIDRVTRALSWQHSEGALLRAYERALSVPRVAPASPAGARSGRGLGLLSRRTSP